MNSAFKPKDLAKRTPRSHRKVPAFLQNAPSKQGYPVPHQHDLNYHTPCPPSFTYHHQP